MATSTIELHPENDSVPHVIVTRTIGGAELWFACRTREDAEELRPQRERDWSEAEKRAAGDA